MHCTLIIPSYPRRQFLIDLKVESGKVICLICIHCGYEMRLDDQSRNLRFEGCLELVDYVVQIDMDASSHWHV